MLCSIPFFAAPAPARSLARWAFRPLLAIALCWLLLLLGAAGPAFAEAPPANVVRLHFHRVSHDYTGWGLHLWGSNLVLTRDVTWERPLEPAGVDAYGVYFDVPIDPSATGFNFILHRGETKNHPKDQLIDLARHGREVWLLENTETVFTAPPPVGSDFQLGLETEEKRQRNVAMLWGGAGAVVLAVIGIVWLVQRRAAGARSDLSDQLAKLMEAQNEMRLRNSAASALEDELTGLPTRSGLQHALEQAIGRAKRGGGRTAVLFIDLDGFKAVNDGAGHDAGDLVLKVLAQRFKACLRESDMVARVGGDEFVAVIESLQSPLHAFNVGRKLLAAARLPIEDEGRVHQVGASIGVAVYPLDGQDAATLMKGADTAMYGAKKGGKDACRFLQCDLQAQMDAHLQREDRLREALDRGELRLDYVPDLDLASGRVLGADAVPRWAGDGTPAPLHDMFDTAQDEVLAERLNAWMLSEASRQAQTWRNQGLPPVRIAVNLLGETASALEKAHRLLSGDRAAAHGLVVQLRPGLLDDHHGHVALIDALHALGVGVGVTGLGVQDLSLLRLVETPIDLLKLQAPRYVAAASASADGLARSLVALGAARMFRVVASDVDTPAQREWCRRMVCGSTMPSMAAGTLGADAFAKMLGLRTTEHAPG